MEDFKVKEEYIKLGQLLKATSIASDGIEAKMMISEGMVKVDNNIENRRGAKIRPGQVVEVKGKIINII